MTGMAAAPPCPEARFSGALVLRGDARIGKSGVAAARSAFDPDVGVLVEVKSVHSQSFDGTTIAVRVVMLEFNPGPVQIAQWARGDASGRHWPSSQRAERCRGSAARRSRHDIPHFNDEPEHRLDRVVKCAHRDHVERSWRAALLVR
jgi:hypothetical protein